MAGVKDQQMKEITERLEQGVKEMFTSEMYTKYLQTMSQFHRYSFNNTLLIAMQKPEATLVAGYQAWQKKFKRQVKRGEKGIQIIAPTPIREKEVVEKVDPVTNELVIGADGRPETEEVENIIPRFRVTTVFDVSQTYGEPLPQLETPELMGNVENYEVFLQALREISPYEIQFEEIEDGAKGRCRHTDREIIIQQDMSESQTMKTAVHEVAHAKLHNQDVMEELGETKDRTTKEVEAESVAYTVCQYFGLDTSDYSFPYIAGWSGDKDMKELRTSMDTIRKTAGEFIDSMTEAMQRLMREQQQQHLQDTDLVLEYALPQEEGYCYFVVRRMEKAGLAVQLASYQELYGESHEKELDVFLQEQGAEVIPWFDSNGLQVEYPVSFYDLAFDLTNGITDAEELPAMSYATMLIDRAEYGKTLFEAEDRNLIVNYAYKFGDKEAVKTLVDDMLAALEASDSRLFREVCGKAQAEIDALDERAVADNDSGRVNEKLYLSGKDDRYAIYQIAGGTKGRDYQFMGMDFINSHNMTVDAADYRFIYGGRLSEQDTLDSLYERFNINHPADYTGHSLSVSDVVVIQRDGETKAYFVDSIGYAELPDFIPRRLHEAEMNRKREDSAITFDTTDVEIEQHEGLWHPVDKIEIADEIFYLMRHNEYGDSVAAVILSADGELVAQELENGFDRGALEAIREYLADKGIAWEPEMQELGAEEKTYPPVYRESLTYAMEHASADEYLDSRKLTIDCKKAVEAAIKEKFDGMHLADDAVDSVLAEYGSERLSFVLACTVQHKMDDGRFSRDTKAWAEGISVPENTDRGRDMTMDYVVESHPAVLDGFIGMAREKFKGLEQAQDRNDSKVSIARFYVVNDAYGVKAEREYQYFRDLDAALTAYAALPNHLDKQLGMESTENVPSRMSLINCRNGIEELNDIKAVSLSGKWENPETEASLSQAKEFMKERDTEIAYQMGSRYFYIQTIPDGYDYTFYNEDLSDIDGGILDRPGIPIKQAIDEIVEDFAGAAHPPLKAIDLAVFKEKVEAVQKEAMEQAQASAPAVEEAAKELPLISDSTKPERALNWKSRAEIEETVLCYAQARVDEMGLSDEVKLLGARVCGSRTRSSLAEDGSDMDVVLSYTGNIREDVFFNSLHENGLEIACLTVDINPISLEQTGPLEEYMVNAESYLDEKEAQKLAEDIDRFEYYRDTDDYKDRIKDQESHVLEIKEDIVKGEILGMEDWLQSVVLEDGRPKNVHGAKELIQRLIDRTDGKRFTVCETTDAYEEAYSIFDRVNGDYYKDQDGFTPLFVTEQEAMTRAAEINEEFKAQRDSRVEPEPKIFFSVAECMEFPVLGEYHDNLTLQEAFDIYNQIPAGRLSGGKGIGFRLEDGSAYGVMNLMSAGFIDKEVINGIAHYKESPLVQKAITDLEVMMDQEKSVESHIETAKGEQTPAAEPQEGATHPETAEPKKEAPEAGTSVTDGGGRKQSVLQALRNRQAKIREKESQNPEKETNAHKKGEPEL